MLNKAGYDGEAMIRMPKCHGQGVLRLRRTAQGTARCSDSREPSPRHAPLLVLLLPGAFGKRCPTFPSYSSQLRAAFASCPWLGACPLMYSRVGEEPHGSARPYTVWPPLLAVRSRARHLCPRATLSTNIWTPCTGRGVLVAALGCCKDGPWLCQPVQVSTRCAPLPRWGAPPRPVH